MNEQHTEPCLAIALLCEGWQIEITPGAAKIRPTQRSARGLSSKAQLRTLEEKLHRQLSTDGPIRRQLFGKLATDYDVSILLGVTSRVVRRWLESQTIPGIKFGASWYVAKAWLDAMQAEIERIGSPDQRRLRSRIIKATTALARAVFVRAQASGWRATLSPASTRDGGDAT